MYSEENSKDIEQICDSLHSKYHNMNNIEVPHMKFEKRQGKLDLKLVRKLNLQRIIESNNITPLENISRNLIFSEITDSDFNDKTKAHLFSQFQYAVEYLNEKISRLEMINKKLDTEYNLLINNSYKLEEQLKKNKIEIEKNASEKKEREYNLITYQSIVEFHCNPGENINKITKNINIDYDNYIGINNTGYEGRMQSKFFCHICNGKFFNTESRLESHMKRRHLAQLKSNLQKQREEQKEAEFQEKCEQKLEDTKKYLETLIQQRNEILNKGKYEDEINMIKRENEEKMKYMTEHTKKMSDNLYNIAQQFRSNQEENNKNILALANASSNRKGENNEPQKIIIENACSNEINNLANSIQNLGEIFKNKEKNLAYEEENINKFKMKTFDISTNKNINYKDYQNENINQYQNSNTNNNIIDNESSNNFHKNPNIKQNQNTSENNILNQQNNINQKIINDNNISLKNSQNQIYNNNPQDHGTKNNESTNTPIIREKKNENEKMNNEILPCPNDQIKMNNDQFINKGENCDSKLIKIHQGESPKIINIFNKTAPNNFKKRKFIPIEPINLASSGSLKDIDIFYAKYMNRDQPLFDEEKPELKNYLKNLIPEEKRKKENEINENVENFIKERAKKINLEFDDFENKRKSEILDIIDKTMQNINEINSKNQVREMYYDTIQKAIDIKLLEENEKMKKTAYNNKGELKRSRSSSKAKIAIENAEKEINI